MFQNTKKRMKSSNFYFPEFDGSTGECLEVTEKEENYIVTWMNNNTKYTVEDNIFEISTDVQQ